MRIYLVDGACGNLRNASQGLDLFLGSGNANKAIKWAGDGLSIFLGADSNGTRKHSDVASAALAVADFTRDIRLRCLLSFYYYAKVDLDSMFSPDVPEPIIMADSGAFSALTLGVPINISDYANWLKRWECRLSVYANLDVIGDPKATLDNQRRLEDKGLAPLPVFHVNEPWEYLEYYLENYDYVALGGLVPHAMRVSSLMPWLIKAFKMLPKGKGYHGFGVTGWTILKSFPWASVDSTSWSIGYRYGRVPLFSPVEGKLVSAYLGDPVSCYRYRHLFEYCGYDWKDFADRTKNTRAKIAGVSAVSYLRIEEWLRRKHAKAMKVYLSTIPGDFEKLKEGTNGKHSLRYIGGNG